MGFRSSAQVSALERDSRKLIGKNRLRFGIDFLDDALKGILQDDLILIGAPSGVGKTQLCCNIALANLEIGKRVNYVALEAGEFEIERRLKFPLILDAFLSDSQRQRVNKKITFSDWLLGDHAEILEKYENQIEDAYLEKFKNLAVMYKAARFGVEELIETVVLCSEETDLIIIDHAHYFDIDDDNENRAIKQIAKTVRTLALEEQKPIVLVAHLRKRDKQNEELVPGLDEFHGSSDLYKIATKVVTFSPGQPTTSGHFETFFRVPKNRLDGGVTRYLGKEFYSPKRGGYESGKYRIGWAGQLRKTGFAEIDPGARPVWARNENGTGGGVNVFP